MNKNIQFYPKLFCKESKIMSHIYEERMMQITNNKHEQGKCVNYFRKKTF